MSRKDEVGRAAMISALLLLAAACANRLPPPTVGALASQVTTEQVYIASDRGRSCNLSIGELDAGDLSYQKRLRALAVTVAVIGESEPPLYAVAVSMERADVHDLRDRFGLRWPVRIDRIAFGPLAFDAQRGSSIAPQITDKQPLSGPLFVSHEARAISAVEAALASGSLSVSYTITGGRYYLGGIAGGYRRGDAEGGTWTVPTLSRPLERQHQEEFRACIGGLGLKTEPSP